MIDITKLHVLKEGCCPKNGWITWHLCEFCNQPYTPVEGHDCANYECPLADAVMTAYVGWNEHCLLKPEVSEKYGKILDYARGEHNEAHHFDSDAAMTCFAKCIDRLGWPSTVWRNGEPTTTWDHNARG